MLDSLEGNTVDARFSIRGTQKPPKNLVVVAIDNKTYQDLNTFPFPRTYYAQLINNIAAEHPAAIVFDIDLENKSTIGKTCKVQGATYPCDDLALLDGDRQPPERHGVRLDAASAERQRSGPVPRLGPGDARS